MSLYNNLYLLYVIIQSLARKLLLAPATYLLYNLFFIFVSICWLLVNWLLVNNQNLIVDLFLGMLVYSGDQIQKLVTVNSSNLNLPKNLIPNLLLKPKKLLYYPS